MERSEEELAEPNTRFIILALVFLGTPVRPSYSNPAIPYTTQEAADVTSELVKRALRRQGADGERRPLHAAEHGRARHW